MTVEEIEVHLPFCGTGTISCARSLVSCEATFGPVVASLVDGVTKDRSCDFFEKITPLTSCMAIFASIPGL